jgi:nucleoid DNA-binding protein
MNKKDLIEAIAKETNMPETKTKLFLDSFFNVIGQALAKDDGVKIIGYLDFNVRKTNESFIHPVTKATHKAKYKKAVRVKVGKTLKAIANGLSEKEVETKTSKK